MTEAPGSAAETGVGEPYGLLATKLFVPRSPPGFISRPRLVEWLDQGIERGLILVCAPPGFGKTALVADWIRRGRRSVAWLSLDAADTDPALFWRHATAALDRVRPGIAEKLGPLIDAPTPSMQGLVTALINELSRQSADEELVLVLDDYHLIESELVHASLVFLLEHLPERLRLVLLTRADPPLPLARLRVRGQLAELRDVDLRFTREEAAALLQKAVGPNVYLSEEDLSALATRTEGGVAGLQLAALSLRGRTDVPGFVATFSGSNRYILDYLVEEVLQHQPEAVRRFLLETSVLDQLSGELCDAVTSRKDGQLMLQAIERANLFLVPLDEVRGWWRYHHLFADLLRARLRQEHSDRIPVLHRAAANWCEEHGLADDAVRHALGAGDATWAARLIERHADEFMLRDEQGTLQRWLAALPAELIGSRPRLLLVQLRTALVGADVPAAESLLDATDRAFAAAAEEPFEPSVGTAASRLGNVPATIALARAWLALIRGDAPRAMTLPDERKRWSKAVTGGWKPTPGHIW